jgi:hypothetical protein
MSARWLLRTMIHLVVLLIAFSLSGIAGAFEAGGREGARECCSDCPDENQGQECPPGCPSCHCAHGSLALPKQVEDRAATRRNDLPVIVLRPDEASVPQAPILPGIYRPPRGSTFAI